ncbi:MAG TPA: hypothetical protein VMW62_17615 [Chloroflexota bacterium]|nr:hypothetical protein [Chloroflexota bacterium]
MRYPPSISIAFFGGVALLAAGQVVPNYDASAFLNLLGGALLVVVAIRALASWAGLHRSIEPALESGESLLVESQGVMVQTRTLLVRSRRGPYRARLTNLRLLLSLRVFKITTQRDVAVAWLISGRALSVLSIEVRPSGEILLTPERRFGPRLRFWVPNPGAWEEALRASHPELLRQPSSSGSKST